MIELISSVGKYEGYCKGVFGLTPCYDIYIIRCNNINVGIIEYYPLPKTHDVLYVKYVEIEESYRRQK